jgi:DNA-binding GntR family transcriptional regulator
VSVALALDPAQAEPIARQVERALRQAIVTMRIRPGEMLSEQDIARRFGVSRQPVREAFIKLGEADLVRILPQRGTLVVKISRAAVEDARFIREAVECAVARAAAERRNPALVAAIGSSMIRQRRAARARTARPSSSSTRSFTVSWRKGQDARSPGASSRTSSRRWTASAS